MVRSRRALRWSWLALVFVAPVPAYAPDEPRCGILCVPELKFEPTWTIENLASRHRIDSGGTVATAARERVFELIFAVDIPTSIPRIGTTLEASFAPFADDNDVELEVELNIDLFGTEQTGG